MISHITYSVSDLKASINFYNRLFDSRPVAVGDNLAYYDLDGLWFALNYESVNRTLTYNHIAFYIKDIKEVVKRLNENKFKFNFGRKRACGEGESVYIRDLDDNLIEFHTKTLKDRLDYYKKNRKDIQITL